MFIGNDHGADTGLLPVPDEVGGVYTFSSGSGSQLLGHGVVAYAACEPDGARWKEVLDGKWVRISWGQHRGKQLS